MVGICYRDASESINPCFDSGSLISNKHVLTTGQSGNFLDYLLNADNIPFIRMGSDSDTIERGILHFFVHEQYDQFQLNNQFNFAVLELDEIVPFGTNIQPICLPQSPFEDYTGKLATVAGWIPKRRGSGEYQISVPIWPNEECIKIPEYKDDFNDNMIGAGPFKNGTRIPCNSDIGHMFIEGEQGSMEIIGLYFM